MLILSKLTKTLEDESIHLSNKNRGIANYACSLKSKKAKPSKQVWKRGINKKSDNERDIKRQVKKYKTCRRKHKENY